MTKPTTKRTFNPTEKKSANYLEKWAEQTMPRRKIPEEKPRVFLYA